MSATSRQNKLNLVGKIVSVDDNLTTNDTDFNNINNESGFFTKINELFNQK